MKPADHGSEGIHDAATLYVERAHVARTFLLLTHRHGPFKDLLTNCILEGRKTFDDIEIFRKSVVVKVGAAAIIITSRALESIIDGDVPIGTIHGVI
jgi:hypothetical protein